jgi:hypothetical protein
LLFWNVAFAASRKNNDVINIYDDSDDNHYQLKTPPPAVFKTSGMPLSPQKKKQKSSGKEICSGFPQPYSESSLHTRLWNSYNPESSLECA